MKYLRVLLLAFAVLGFAMAAAGDSVPDIHIVFDPSIPAIPGSLYIIQTPGTSYTVSWLNCSAYSSFNPAPKFDACLGFFNNTGAPLTNFDISFTVPSTGPGSTLIGQPVDCTTLGPNLTDNTCPSGNLTAGEVVNDISFFGGTPVSNETAFFVGEDGVACDNPSDGLVCSSLPPTTVADASAPEAGTLLLFGTGLMVLGLGLEWRRKRVS